MVNYNCNICNYITKRHYDYNKHLKTKKHINNEKKYEEEKYKKQSQNLKIPHFPLKIPQNTSQISHHKNKEYIKCEYCYKEYNRIDNLNRHIEKYCKKKKELDKMENENSKIIEKQNKIIESQSKQINKLLEKNVKQINNTQNNNNSNNTINNTIHINNYGEENLEMLTDEFKEKCVTRPFYAILEIIKKIHFNDDYPENKNMRLVNKRDNKIQVLDDGKWKYRYKDEAVKYAFDDSNERLEQFCVEKSHKFRKFIKICCEDIIKNIHECEPELYKELYKEMDLILLNGC
jgi:hypothetical protein